MRRSCEELVNAGMEPVVDLARVSFVASVKSRLHRARMALREQLTRSFAA